MTTMTTINVNVETLVALVDELKRLAANRTFNDDYKASNGTVCLNVYAGGNIDDAFLMGQCDGATQCARDLLAKYFP